MSDFDTVLERLLTDPSFASELSRDPDRALAEYRLEDGEAELLRSQVASDSHSASALVEDRMTKSSTFGMFSSLGEWSEFGSAAGVAARQSAESMGGHGAGAGGGEVPLRTGLGDAPGRDLDELPAVSRMGEAPSSGMGDGDAPKFAQMHHVSALSEESEHQAVQTEHQVAQVEHQQADLKSPEPPKGYHNKVDADGDGHWDKATYAGREDGGVDILVDLNNDGNPDFIGRDLDADWTVDNATIDRDRDGVFEKTMYDDNGDGWLDRTVWHND